MFVAIDCPLRDVHPKIFYNSSCASHDPRMSLQYIYTPTAWHILPVVREWAMFFCPIYGKFVKDISVGLNALVENKIVEEVE